MNNDESLKAAICDRLEREHVGRSNAIPYKELALAFDINDRLCRNLVKEIVCDGRLPIGGATQPPEGYYIPENQSEYQQIRNDLISRIKSLRDRVDGLEIAYERRMGQQKLDGHEQVKKALEALDKMRAEA